MPQLVSSLTYLNLNGCCKLEDADLIPLAPGLSSLTYLDVSNCNILTNRAVIALAEHCTALTSLRMDGWVNPMDAAMVAMAQGCTSLTFLGLRNCGYNFTNTAVNTLLGHFTALNDVDLRDGGVFADAVRLALQKRRGKNKVRVRFG
jgi:hypothetical protein